MRVATFNICHGQPASGGEVDPEQLAKACQALDADLLALQEVDRNVARSGGVDLAAVVAEATGMQMVFGQARELDGGSYGNALLARGHLGEVEVAPLPRSTRKWARREARCALLATATIDDLEVTVLATHLCVFLWESAVQLGACVGLLHRRRSKPVVMLGDFNRRPTQLGPLVDAGLVVAGGPPTFPVRRPLARLDHVVVSPELTFGGVEVVRSPVSDHAALVVEVERATLDAEGGPSAGSS